MAERVPLAEVVFDPQALMGCCHQLKAVGRKMQTTTGRVTSSWAVLEDLRLARGPHLLPKQSQRKNLRVSVAQLLAL